MANKFIITDKQKERLKNLLTEEEYSSLLFKEWEDFTLELNELIVMYFNNDEPTEKSNELERILDEIENTNYKN